MYRRGALHEVRAAHYAALRSIEPAVADAQRSRTARGCGRRRIDYFLGAVSPSAICRTRSSRSIPSSSTLSR
jgi:hypothetical protein